MPFKSFPLPAHECLVRDGRQEEEQRIDGSLLRVPSELAEQDTLNMADDGWDSWLKWDGTIEALPSFESRRQSIASSFYGSESSALDLSGSRQAVAFSEDDALFELEESTVSLPFPSHLFAENDYTKSDPNSMGQPMKSPGRPLHAYSTLSLMEERRLRDIAMPGYIAPGAANIDNGENVVPTAIEARVQPRGIKRKSSAVKEDQLDVGQHRKQSHNKVEKRYRLSLNDKIDILRQSIPKFHDTTSKTTEGHEAETSNEKESPSACKSGKAAVLTSAVDYISQLESSTKRLGIETAALKARLAAFEQLAVAGAVFSGEEMYPDDTPMPKSLEDFEQATTMKATTTGTDSSHSGRKKQLVRS